MKKRRKIGSLAILPMALVILLCFLTAVSQLDSGRQEEGKQQLEDVLRRTAAACYAAEGAYPPDLAYMCRNYGVHYDEQRYTVLYEVFASNLMPDITVLDNTS